MKKKIIVIAVIAVMLIVAGWYFLAYYLPITNRTFDGSRTANAERYYLDFKYMNTEDTQIMHLLEGEDMKVEWDITKGKISVTIGIENETPIYTGQISNANFKLGIPKTGDYVITVKGQKAKGSMSFERQHSN